MATQELLKKAFKYHANGDINNAEKYYKKFLDDGHSDSRVLSNYGVICNKLGKRDEAKKLYQKSI